jgi:hypothetical protein
VSAAARKRRFPWGVYALLLVAILIFALWPLAGVLVSGWIAESHGCVLNEASAHPCVIDGTDWGSTLAAMFVMGWFMLATIPLGAGALLVLIVVAIIHRLAWGRHQKLYPPELNP